MELHELTGWLDEEDPERIAGLLARADRVRRESCGDEVHLRGLLEISNHCRRNCRYCGLRRGHRELPRYRMDHGEILAIARAAVAAGFGTLVIQAGEDPAHSDAWVADLVARLKGELDLAVTLSLGERSPEDYARWRRAGADRYLLRFETGDPHLYGRIHPHSSGRVNERLGLLRLLGRQGYEIGGGVMVGLPGQDLTSLARDILLFRELELDMVGVGPFIPNPDTPLGAGASPPDEVLALKVLALTRIVLPLANLPAVTSIQSLSPREGLGRALAAGANVIMPNLTPPARTRNYRIYPGKPVPRTTPRERFTELARVLAALGRRPGEGRGDSASFLEKRKRKVECP